MERNGQTDKETNGQRGQINTDDKQTNRTNRQFLVLRIIVRRIDGFPRVQINFWPKRSFFQEKRISNFFVHFKFFGDRPVGVNHVFGDVVPSGFGCGEDFTLFRTSKTCLWICLNLVFIEYDDIFHLLKKP